jgi:sec-independent protein translocase protein TatA
MFPGPVQMLIVVAVIILLFGAKRLPATMRSIGKSVTEFKKGINDTTDDDPAKNDTGNTPPPAAGNDPESTESS